MAIGMHNIGPVKGAKRARKRVGRGLGSTGTYSGRGGKGQTARSGVSGLKRLGTKRWVLAQPKFKGTKSLSRPVAVVNLSSLEKVFASGDVVNLGILKEKKLVGKNISKAKILGNGELTLKIQIEGCLVSNSAKEKIEKAGGKVI